MRNIIGHNEKVSFVRKNLNELCSRVLQKGFANNEIGYLVAKISKQNIEGMEQDNMAANKPSPSRKWKSNPEGNAEISKVATVTVGAKGTSPQDDSVCPQFQRGRHATAVGPENETSCLKDRTLSQKGLSQGLKSKGICPASFRTAWDP